MGVGKRVTVRQRRYLHTIGADGRDDIGLLAGHEQFATATTGRLLQERLGLPVTCFRSGPKP